MKKLLLSLTLVASLSVVATAQTEKGGWIVGAQAANVSYNTTADIFTLTLSPQAGYFVADNFAIGANLRISMSNATGSNTVWAIGPFARAYFGGTEKSKFYAQANTGLVGMSGATAYNLGATLGHTYFITRNVGLETALGYNYSDSTNGGMGSSDLGLNLGFQIYLGKKK